MAFSAVGNTKVKKETVEVSLEAERHAVTSPSSNCNGYDPVMYSLGTRDPRQNIYLQRHFPNPAQEGPSQSQHLFRNEASRGVGRATHDFLSLYGGIPSHFVEPNPSRGASSSLTTQDLLQPLERGNSPKYQDSKLLLSEKPTKEEGLSQQGSIVTATVDSFLPIYSSSPMDASEISRMQLLRLAGPDGNLQGIRCKAQMSLSASHEEHLVGESMRSSDVTVEQEHIESRKCWSNPRADYALSDLLYAPKCSSNHGALDGCYQPIPVLSRHWQKGNHPFVEVVKLPIKVPSGDEEDEVDGLDHAKEQSEHASRDGKSMDARATTPRSKHSATEQRRRSKINDRFQMLRNLVPHSDQKRDKASFLLEVIEYVQVLQEKVRKHEGIDQGRYQERVNNLAWQSCKKTAVPEAILRDTTTMDNAVLLKNITSADFYPSVRQQSNSPINGRSAVLGSEIDASPENHAYARSIPKSCSSLLSGQHVLQTTVPAPHPTPDSQAIPGLSRRYMDELAHPGEESASAVNLTEQSQTHLDAKHQMQLAVERKGRSAEFLQSMPVEEKSVAAVNAIQGSPGNNSGSEEMQMHSSHVNTLAPTRKEEGLTNGSKDKVETPATHSRDESFAVTGGNIRVSSVYSQELLNTLAHALQSSGLDLSQASISVQIDLGKRGGDSRTFSLDKQTIRPTPESSSQSQQSKGRARLVGSQHESDLNHKKPKVQDD